MRTTAACPKCSGKKIIVAELRYTDTEQRPVPVPVVAVTLSGWNGGTKVFGSFESWTCAACGYTEFYAHDLGDVEALAAKQPDAVGIVDGTVPSKGPFR